MYSATPYLTDAFPELSSDKARKILAKWMETFAERHKTGV